MKDKKAIRDDELKCPYCGKQCGINIDFTITKTIPTGFIED